MGTMMKELLVIISIAMACGGLHIPIEDVNGHTDVPIQQCVIEREVKDGEGVIGVFKRPYVDPGDCKNIYADIPCAHLYPVIGEESQKSHMNPHSDYLVSARCYEGPLKDYATFCSSQCALCCKSPKFNCTNLNKLRDCDVIQQLGLCKEAGMVDYVDYFCHATCGLCEEPEFEKDLCEDEYGGEQCRRLFGLVPCTVPFMSNRCRYTCFMVGKQCLSERVLIERIPGGGGSVIDGGPPPRGDGHLLYPGSGGAVNDGALEPQPDSSGAVNDGALEPQPDSSEYDDGYPEY